MDKLYEHLLHPGSSLGLIPFINGAIITLFCVLGYVVVYELQIAAVHVVMCQLLYLLWCVVIVSSACIMLYVVWS